MGEDGLKMLEYLSLVSKVCTELESHTGTGDKVLAEFITELGRNSGHVEEFDAQLKENGAEMPDYFVRTLLTVIHAILPPKPKSEKESNKDSAADGRKTKFKALAMADDRDRAKELEKELEMEARQNHGEREREDKDRYRDRDRDRRDRRRDRYERQERHRERNRDYEYEDERRDYTSNGRHGDRHDRRRRDEHEENRYGRENSDEDRDRKSHRDRRYVSNEPELYQVYKGRVSRVMDTGCFVQLDDFRGKEGLVHVSQMATRRISNAKDVVKRDQEVYVKVISISDQKFSLSMRDVDQHTGKDLLPWKKSLDDGSFRMNPQDSKEGPVTGTSISGIKIVEEDDDIGSSCRPYRE